MATGTTDAPTVAGTMVTSLRTELAAYDCTVEKYRRTDMPSGMRVTVHPVRDKAEKDVAIGNDFMTGWEINVIAEQYWDNKAATADSVAAVAAAIRSWVDANRSYVAGYVMTLGDVLYHGVLYPGRGPATKGDQTFVANMTINIDPPRMPGG